MSSYNNEAAEAIPAIAIAPHEWTIVSGILQRHLPGWEVWAYGSRARRERVSKYSDLDIAIAGERVEPAVLRELIEAFDECLLPFKVDVVEVAAISPEFRQRIEADKVVLQSAGVNH